MQTTIYGEYWRRRNRQLMRHSLLDRIMGSTEIYIIDRSIVLVIEVGNRLGEHGNTDSG